MELKQLKYFVTVADEGSISAAARKLFMSQPPLSLQIKLLEKELDCCLFERGARRVSLTEQGKYLYDKAQSLLKIHDNTKEEILSLTHSNSGTVRLGVVSSVVNLFSKKFLKDFSTEYPEIKFEITEANTYNLLEKIKSNEIQIAIVRTPCDIGNLDKIELNSENLVVVSADNNSFSDKTVSIKQLKNNDFVIYRRWENLIMRASETFDLKLKLKYIVDDARTVINLVNLNAGIGIVPQSIVKDTNLNYAKVSELNIKSDIILIYNKNSYLPNSSKKFINFIKETK